MNVEMLPKEEGELETPKKVALRNVVFWEC